MFTIHTTTCAQTTRLLRSRCHNNVVVHSLSSQQMFFQLLHIMDPRMEWYLTRCSPRFKSGQLDGHISGGWTLVFLSVPMWQCHMHGAISLTSTLRHQVRDAYVTPDTVHSPLWLVFTYKVAHQKSWRSVHTCKSYCDKSKWHSFLFGHCVVLDIKRRFWYFLRRNVLDFIKETHFHNQL